MRFSVEIPPPTSMRVGKEVYHLLAAGTDLHRIHLDAFGSIDFNATAKGSARFSPIRDAAWQIIPTLYAGQSFECAVCEIILRCPDTPPAAATSATMRDIVHPRDHLLRVHSHVRTLEELRLVAVTASGQRKIGVNGNALLAGPTSTYPITRAWAERIHANCPEAQGLYYTSYQYGPEFAVVLFGDRVPRGALQALAKRAVTERDCHNEIYRLADDLSIDYADV